MNKEDIAEFLLQKGYVLTALEFYQELLEDDGTELQSLKDHFIKQKPSFEVESSSYKSLRALAGDGSSGSQSLFQHHSHTYTNNDLADRLKEKDEKLSLIEYELRRAREDITNLRTQLTNIVKKPLAPALERPTSLDEPSGNHRENINEQEVKILNYLIRNFLVQNKYSLTAITFSEEMAEELTTWESVGLETPEPPPLPSLYRHFFEDGGNQGALAKAITETSKLKKDIAEKDMEHKSTVNKILLYQKENEQLQSKITELASVVESLKMRQASPFISSDKSRQQNEQDHKQESHSKSTIAIPPTIGSGSHTKPSASQNDVAQRPMQIVFKNLIRKTKRSRTCAISSSTEIDPDEASHRIAQEVSKIGLLQGDHQVVQIVANCLPHIISGVLINKREELIPVIIVAISRHPSSVERLALIKLLFNLIKKPNEQQRQVIMNGCVSLASLIGPQRTETELLSQCWEQIADNHAERRALVADSCGQLVTYVQSESRLSFVLSTLQQMVEDRSALVRAAVACSVAHLVNCLEDSEKYAQIIELFIRLLCDPDLDVHTATVNNLFPAMVDWSDLIDVFHAKFLNTILSELQSIVMLKTEDGRNQTEQDLKQLLHPLLKCFRYAIPRMREVVFASNPSIKAAEAAVYETQSILNISSSKMRTIFPNAPPIKQSSSPATYKNTKKVDSDAINQTSTVHPSAQQFPQSQTQPHSPLQSRLMLGPSDGYGDSVIQPLLSDEVITKLKSSFDSFITSQPEGSIDTKDWPMLDWMVHEMMPQLLQIILVIPTSFNIIISSLVEIISSICVNFGIPFARRVVKSVFIAEMNSNQDLNNSVNNKKLILLPVYLSGVVTSLDEAEIIKYLHELIVNISMEENGWGHDHLPVLKGVVGQLSVQSSVKSDYYINVILDTLCEMVSHPSNQVRLCVVTLFNVMIPAAKATAHIEKILPALVALSNDPDSYVNMECIEPLANIAANSPSDNILDKIASAFDKMIKSEDYHVTLAVVLGLTNIIPHLTFKRQFRDLYILPLLVELARRNSGSNSSADDRRKMGNALFEAFRAFASASLTKETIEAQVLPGLKSLLFENDRVSIDPSFKIMVQSMIRDMRNNISTFPTSPEKTFSTNKHTDTVLHNQPIDNDNHVNNVVGNSSSNNNFNNEKSNNTTNTTSNNPNTLDKGSTKKNLLGKLDAASITAASITSSLKMDFDKALPKWTWKNK